MKRLLYLLMTLLGFGLHSCKVEYGAPYVNYKLSVRVVDEAGKPIPGIEVRKGFDYGSYFVQGNDLTDSNGEYIMARFVSYATYPTDLLFEDIDGELNGGEFESKSVNISDKFVLIEDGGGWYEGRYEAVVGDIVLEKKTETEEQAEY